MPSTKTRRKAARRNTNSPRRTPPNGPTAARTAAINSNSKRIRYAVVGLGHLAQIAVLPAFAHARENSEVVALVSGDATKLKKVAARYKIKHAYSYETFHELLSSELIDALYIVLPNSMHRAYAIAAAQAGVHVICEKPMAVTAEDCRGMIQAADDAKTKLMIAYRLHFEEANLDVQKVAHSGEIGDLKYFDSLFSLQVAPGNIRTKRELGGGTLYDIGVYCINAARAVFRSEPEEVFAFAAQPGKGRFAEIEESVSATLRFPGERLATFTCSFGAADVSTYDITGSLGRIHVEPAYEYAEGLKYELTAGETTTKHSFPKRDQFAAELIYFSNCILNNKQPEPSGEEGLADIRIVEALYKSIDSGKPVKLDHFEKSKRPEPSQEIHKPPVKKPEDLVKVAAPTRS
jgi:predicted dehydrogenase